MSDERGDSRMASFLIGFFCGALLAGGGGYVAFFIQTHRLAQEAQMQAAMAAEHQARAEMARRMAEVERARAEAERAKAEEELRKAKQK